MSYRLKLTKARSYTRGNITATQEKPLVDVEDAGTAEALLSSGYFTLVTSTLEAENGADELVIERIGTLRKLAANMGIEGADGLDRDALLDAICTKFVEADSGAVSESAENPEPDSSEPGGTEADSDGTDRTETDSSEPGGTEADSDGTDRTETDNNEPEGTETKPDYDALSKMSKADLTAYAKERDIDISKCKTKSDILTAISMAYGGSPTMIDLQREPDGQGGDDE